MVHWLVVCVDNVHILSGRLCTIKKKTESLVVASKETGLGVKC